jgi:hypothetical protein
MSVRYKNRRRGAEMKSRNKRLHSQHSEQLRFELLEPRLLLTTTFGEVERQSLKEAFQSLAGFTSNLEQSDLLNTTIPILYKKIGELVDVDQLLRERFLTPVRKYLDTAQPTLEGFQTLFQSGLVGMSSVPLGQMLSTPTLVNQRFKTDFGIDIVESFPFEYDLGTQLKGAGVEAAVGKLAANLDFEIHLDAGIEIDLSKVGGAPSDVVTFTLKDGTKTSGSRIVAKATSTLDHFEASIGIAGAQVQGAELVLDVALPMDFGVGAATEQAGDPRPRPGVRRPDHAERSDQGDRRTGDAAEIATRDYFSGNAQRHARPGDPRPGRRPGRPGGAGDRRGVIRGEAERRCAVQCSSDRSCRSKYRGRAPGRRSRHSTQESQRRATNHDRAIGGARLVTPRSRCRNDQAQTGLPIARRREGRHDGVARRRRHAGRPLVCRTSPVPGHGATGRGDQDTAGRQGLVGRQQRQTSCPAKKPRSTCRSAIPGKLSSRSSKIQSPTESTWTNWSSSTREA